MIDTNVDDFNRSFVCGSNRVLLTFLFVSCSRYNLDVKFAGCLGPYLLRYLVRLRFVIWSMVLHNNVLRSSLLRFEVRLVSVFTAKVIRVPPVVKFMFISLDIDFLCYCFCLTVISCYVLNIFTRTAHSKVDKNVNII